MDAAIAYVEHLIDYIEHNIAKLPHKTTPLELSNLGSYYIFYNSNKRTTWYIFFEKQGNTFLITFITNNHKEIANNL